MKKGIYFLLVLLTCCWFSCGTPNQEAQEGETTTTVQEETTANATSTEANPSTTTETGNSKITADVVSKVCNCKKEAKGEDGMMDIEKVRACMGAASSNEYVKNLLGPDATEKELTDALNELMEKTENC